MHMQFLVDPADRVADGVKTDIQEFSDLAVTVAPGELAKHILFTRSELEPFRIDPIVLFSGRRITEPADYIQHTAQDSDTPQACSRMR